mmetsp:Transcript_14029/g.32495  ORF Transcript_14029/g.32495 Transcript_14029/m.32495 type:complete len:148 (-) Transcript_14029:270-713(-)
MQNTQQEGQPPSSEDAWVPIPVPIPGPDSDNNETPPQSTILQHQEWNVGWQSDEDVQERRKMIARIAQILQQRKPNAPAAWLKNLPQMAKRLEVSLYCSAGSFQKYKDETTLKQRLQKVMASIGMMTQRMRQAQPPFPPAPPPQQPH